MERTDWHTKEYLKPGEIMEILDISRTSVYNLLSEVPHVRVGYSYRVKTSDFIKYLKKHAGGPKHD